MFSALQNLIFALNRALHRPGKVFVASAVLVFSALAFDGSLFHLWALHRDEARMKFDIQRVRDIQDGTRARIQKAKDPGQIERDARERFDLVDENDLLFVFSNDE